ncbi:hypothetical protein [Mycobacteroides sp. CBMA 271]|uniref:hypothetical protein n=1 Tax=Mycobacteroides sp. CBMA 271 TaxID=2606608 RepID=UPI001396794B|nr:hypothetical protein [Mycobacteroides sp. CBMA 271]
MPWIVLSVFMGLLIVGLVATVIIVGSSRSITGMPVMPSGETPRTSSQTSATTPTTPVVRPPNGAQGPLGGPTFGPGDKARQISMPKYVPFAFTVPAQWDCVHAEDQPLDSRVICADSADKNGPAGSFGTSRCSDGCAQPAQDAVRSKLPVDAKFWRPVDDVTFYARVTGTLGNGQRVVRIAMTCAFASVPGGGRDTLAVAMITGPPEMGDTLQKVANDVRSRVPA